MNRMTNKQLVEAVSAIQDEVYRIIRREQNKLTADFKTAIKDIIDERTRRGEIALGQIQFSCGSCVLDILNMVIVPYMESSRFAELKASVVESETEYVQMNLVPDEENSDVDLNENPFFKSDLKYTEVTKENFKEVTSKLPIVSEDVFDSIKRAQDILKDRKEYLESFVQSVDAKLNNETYVQNAKPEIIANEREKKAQVDAELKEIEQASTTKPRTKKK